MRTLTKLLILFLLVAISFGSVYSSTVIVNKSGLSDYKTKYFYKNNIDLLVKDYTPSRSDSFYLAISYDGDTYIRLTPNTYYGVKRPATLNFTFVADTVLNNMKIGLFQNPDNTWETKPVDSIEITTELPTIEPIYSTNQFSKGNYTVKFNTKLLPNQDSIDYKRVCNYSYGLYYVTDSSTGSNNVNSVTTKYVKDINLVDDFNIYNTKDYYFQIKTLDGKYTIYTSNLITVKDSLHYLNILTLGGLKQINDQVNVNWESSGFYPNFKIKVLKDNISIKEDTIYTKQYSLNFKDYGFYNFIVSVDNGAFSFTDSVSFYVQDPCIVEKDSIVTLNKKLNDLSKMIDSLNKTILLNDSVINNLTIKVVLLNKYIKDSTVYKIYLNDKITSVYEVLKNNIKSIVVTDFYTFNMYDTEVYLYSEDLTLISSNYYTELTSYNFTNLNTGVYFLVTRKNNELDLIKIIKK